MRIGLLIALLALVACRAGVADYSPNRALKFNQQWYVEHGAIQNPVDLDAVWDPSYTDHALGVLGKR